ncbi:MAG: T9SS type A sorting domain-containing protein [Ferruginibacter sp.]
MKKLLLRFNFLLMSKISIMLLLVFSAVLFTQDSFGQGTMGRWEMCGLTGTTSGSVSSTGVLSNVTFSVLSRGAGITAASASNGYSSTGWSTSTTLSIANNDYYEFTITPTPGYKMSITALKVRDVVSTTTNSPDAYLRFSDDSYAANVVASWSPSTTATNHTLNTSGVTALQNRTTPVTFRIYVSSVSSSTTTTYRLDCAGVAAGNFRGVDVDGTVAQIAYASQLVSINTGAATWCAGETRNVTVQIKNIGSTAWTDGGGNDFNIGVKWGNPNVCTSTGNWCDYHIRTDALNLAPGATGTFTLPLTASNNTGAAYTTVLAAGSYPITFDIVLEGISWFGNNGGVTGPGNTAFTSAAQTVVAQPTLSRTSAAGTDAQTKCINTAITNITYAVGGGGTGASISAGALPAGVTGTFSAGVFTISGTPTASGVFNYTVTTVSSCTNVSLSGTITVNANSTLSLSSAAGTNAQTFCITNPLTTITYAVGGGATGASITAGALPAGVTGSYSAGVFTISGTPTATGSFSYTVTTTGPCTNPSLSGTITVNANSTLSFTSAAGTDAQTKCINTAITNITYLVGAGGTGATVTGLPTGVTGAYNSGTKVFTISGTPSVAGTFNYTVTTTGPCVNPSLGGTITVTPNTTITLTSGAGTNIQTLCINNAITDITYSIGGSGTGAGVTGLPAGVTGTFSAGVFTISGTATASGTFNYTVTPTGPCANPTATGTITVNANSTLSLSSAVGTDAQTICQNTPLTNITYAGGGGITGASITAGALPTGVTGSYNSGTKVFTISGTPTAFGSFPYTVTTTGPCTNVSLSGTIDVTEASSISLVTAGTNNQTICTGSSIVDINYTYGGTATGASITAGALPAGVISGDDGGGNFTITGTPTVTGTFNFTVTANGICPVSLSGTIIVNDNSTITFTSAAGTDAQTLCINTAITNITYLVGGGGTGATVTGLPTGVTGAYNSGTKVFTISGSASVSGSFNYTVTTTGPCINTSLGGTITVTPNTTITLTSGAGTNIQTRCINNAITDITYSIGGSGTGAGVTGLPAGVTGTYSAGVFTISGTPTASGTFNYTVTPTGPCVNPTATGTITVNANSTLTFTSAVGTDAQTKCINIAITNITYLVGAGGTGAGVTGLPTGVTGAYNSGTKVFTISGTPSVAGTFNYTVTTTGPCINTSLGGSITVIANSTITLTSAGATTTQTVCQNANITNITYAVGGSGTGAFATGLPAGVTGSYSAGVFTISGAPTTAASGVFNYTVTTSGPCVNPNLTGTITVNVIPTTTGITICQNGSGSLTSSFVCATGSPVTTSDVFAGAGANSGSGTAWGAPGNVTANDNAYATVSGTGTAFSQSLNSTGFILNIPGNATIKGIEVNISRFRSGGFSGEIQDNSVKLMKAGVAIGTNNAAASTNWQTSETVAAYGTTTDLWGTTWSPAEVNASNFGVALVVDNTSAFFSRQANVDYVQVSVTYTIPGSLNWYTASSGGSSIGSGSPFNPVGVAGSGLPNTNTPGTTVFYAECSTVAGCRTPTNFVINPNSTISLSSAAGTDAQAFCIPNPLTTITYAVGGGATGASITAGTLPAGVTGSYSAGVFTISGTPTATGNFSYTVTTSGGGCAQASLSGTITVNADATITLTSGAGTDAQMACDNAAITNITYAIAGAGTTASVTSGALPAGVTGSFAAGVFTISGTPSVAGVYNYTVTASGGVCVQQSASGTITVNAHPTATFTKTMASSCGGGADGSITVTPTSGLAPITYSWTSTPAGFTANTAAITGLSPKDYTVVISDANFCSVTIPDITIWQAFATVVTNNGGGSSSCGNTGYILLYGSGGVPPYTYSIDGTNYFTSNTFTNLPAATYTGYVKDYAGCVSTKPNIVVTGAASMSVTANTRPASSCANNGTIELYRTGGVGPYTYSLDDVTYQGSNVFNNLVGNATYTGWVKDASGCKASLANISVGKAPAVTVTSTKTNTSACSNTGSIALYAGGGVPGYTYSLVGAAGPYQASNTFTGLAAGSYNGWVQDSKGCKNVQFGITIGTNAAPTITVTASTSNTSSCGNTGSIQLFRSGGTGPYTYSLDNIIYQGSNSFTGLASGSYTGWVKDVNGCTGSLSGITVGQAPAVTATEFHTNTSTCANDGTIQLNAGGGVPGYTYSMDNITYQAGNSFTGFAAGSYTGWVKDSKGCTASVSVTIGTAAAIVVTANTTAASSCATSNGSIQLFRTGGTGPYTYSLDDITYQPGNLFSGKPAGTYTGYVKDSKGCVGSLANIVVGPSCPRPIAGTGTNTKPGASIKASVIDILSVKAYPNPSATDFTLVMTCNSKEKIAVTVTDIMGRKVQQTEFIGKKQYRFGDDLAPGIYIVQVVQGDQKQSIKLIKE